MWDVIKAVLLALVPPNVTADDAAMYRYRIVNSFILVGLTMSLTAHILLACGYLTGTVISFPGFARADTVKDISSSVVQIQLSQVDTKLMLDLTKRCALLKQNPPNGVAVGYLTGRIQYELRQWQQLEPNHTPYSVPDCSVIGDQY